MKLLTKIGSAVLLFFLLFSVEPLFAQNEQTDAALYTAYNIWFEKAEKIYSINYKKGNIIPVGTAVDQVNIITAPAPHIQFRVMEWNQIFNIYFESRYYPDLTIEQLMERTFTSKNFETLVQNLTSVEIDGIKNAKILSGMSKQAVLIAYGFPPSHMTTTLDMNTWTYWRNRWVKDLVEFDEQGNAKANVDWR